MRFAKGKISERIQLRPCRYSEKKIDEEDFLFGTKSYLEKVEAAANQEIQEIIDENKRIIQAKYPNVIYKKSLENIALFVVK